MKATLSNLPAVRVEFQHHSAETDDGLKMMETFVDFMDAGDVPYIVSTVTTAEPTAVYFVFPTLEIATHFKKSLAEAPLIGWIFDNGDK